MAGASIERNLALNSDSTVYDLCAGVGAIGLAIWAGSGARTDLVQAKPRQHPAPPAPAAPTDSPSATEEAPSAPAKTTRRRAKTSQLKPTAD